MFGLKTTYDPSVYSSFVLLQARDGSDHGKAVILLRISLAYTLKFAVRLGTAKKRFFVEAYQHGRNK